MKISKKDMEECTRSEHFKAIKESDCFWGIYLKNSYPKEIITSGISKNDVRKKMKLLEKGFKIGYGKGLNDNY